MSIRIEGLDTIIGNVDKAAEGWQSFIDAFLNAVAERFLWHLYQRVPIRTGDYARSWIIGSPQNDQIIVSSPEGDLYIILEIEGSRPHIIEARFAESLHFFTKDGKELFLRFVNNPGFPPKPHVQPAMDATMNEAIGIGLDLLGTYFQIFYQATINYRGRATGMRIRQ